MLMIYEQLMHIYVFYVVDEILRFVNSNEVFTIDDNLITFYIN